MGRGNRRKASGKKSNTSTILLLVLAGGALLIAGVALVVMFCWGKLDPRAPGFGLELANSQVTAENYRALKSGSRLDEVEALLGKGRVPTSKDFDAVCGTKEQSFTNPFF